MYSKSQSGNEPSFRIPDNYRGYAFGNESAATEPPEPTMADPQNAPAESEVRESDPTSAPASKKTDSEGRISPLASLLPPRPAALRGGLAGEIGLEDLLIIGVLLLVWQNDTDNDILLLLMLLLLYK